MSTTDQPHNSAEREGRIAELVEAYLNQVRVPDANSEQIRAEIVAEHPDLAPELDAQLRIAHAIRQSLPGSKKTTVRAGEGTHVGAKPEERLIRFSCPHCGNKLNLVAPSVAEFTCPTCGSSIPVDPEQTRTAAPRILKTIGRFRLLSTLGKGAFGTAYRAYDDELSRVVAVKIPLGGTFGSDHERQRFLREARSAARLRHPHIVQVYEVDLDGDVPFIVSELIDGVSLADLVSNRQLTLNESVRLIVEVAGALDYAHRQGVIHRDIKPGNILLDGAHRPYISDFGLARDTSGEITMTIAGEILGTPAYMSPEQAQGNHAKMDHRTDIYSLGVVLYRLTSGELPFRGSQRMLLHQVVHDEPRSPRRINDHIPRDLETIILKGMAKEPDKRYESAAAMAEDLRRWLNNESILARPAGPLTRLVRWRRRHPGLASLSATLATLLILFGVMASWWAVRESTLKSDAYQSRSAALVSENRSRSLLAQSYRHNAIRELDSGLAARGLVWLAAALRINPSHETEQRLRIGLLHQNHPDLVQIWSVPDSITTLKPSPDGRRLLVATRRGDVLVYDTSSGQRDPQLRMTHEMLVKKADWNADGSRIATLITGGGQHVVTSGRAFFPSEQGVQLWNHRGQRLAQMNHDGKVQDFAFTPSGDQLVTVGHDGKVRVWATSDGSLLRELSSDLATLSRVYLDPQGPVLVATGSVTLESPAHLLGWNFENGQALWEPQALPAPCLNVEWSNDGKTLFVALKNGPLLLVDAANGKELERLATRGSLAQAFNLNTGDQLLGIANSGDILRWDRTTGREQTLERKVPNQAVAMDSLRRWMALAGSDGGVRLVSLPGLHELPGVLSNGDSSTQVEFAPDGRHLFVAGEYDGQQGVVRMWDLAGLARGLTFLTHGEQLRQAKFSPDGSTAVTYGGDAAPQLWETGSGKPLGERLAHAGGVYDASFSTDGSRLATAGEDRTVRVWDARTGRPIGTPLVHPEPVYRVKYGPHSKLLVAGTDGGQLRGWDSMTGEQAIEMAHTGLVNEIDFRPDGQTVATASFDRTARLWQTRDGAPLGAALRHEGMVTECRFSRDGQQLVTCATDKTVCFWPTTGAAEPLQLFRLPKYASAIAFDPPGTRLLASDTEGRLTVWRRAENQWQPPESYRISKHEYLHAAWHPQLDIILSCGAAAAAPATRQLGAGLVALFDWSQGIPLVPPLPLFSSVQHASFDRAGQRVLAGADDGTAVIWRMQLCELPPDQLTAWAELLSGWRLEQRQQLAAIAPLELVEMFERRGPAPVPAESETERAAAWEAYLAWLARAAAEKP